VRDFFDKVVVISLRRRPERLAEFRANLAEHSWPFAEPQVFEAVDGSKLPLPNGWPCPHGQDCRGTYGCLRSHVRVLEMAILDGVDKLLVLEDDAKPIDKDGSFLRQAEQFLRDVPDDWDQLMLGGQHIDTPIKHCDGVVRVSNTQRTHAYAVRGQFMRELYATWSGPHATTHCDHIMGRIQRNAKVYAPHPFLFAQARGPSDVSGSHNPTKSWNPATGKERVLLLDCPQAVVAQLREHGIHTGYNRHYKTDIDGGLMGIMTAADDRLYDKEGLRRWVRELVEECSGEDDMTLGVWHPADLSPQGLKVTPEMLKGVWEGPTHLIEAVTLEDALAKLKGIGVPCRWRPHPALLYVIVLRAPKRIVPQLREIGWHTGNWRDSVTDVDNGLRAWAEEPSDAKLADVVKTLTEEASKRRSGVACVWMPEMNKAWMGEEVRRVTKLRVVEVIADTVEEAVAQWTAVKSEAFPPTQQVEAA
jgi:hypothetical protein